MMRKMIILGISVVLCCSALAFFLLYYVLPQYYFSCFWMLPVYFSVLLLLEILLMNIFKEKSAKTMNVFLITKIVKFLLSVCLIVLYLNVVAENNIAFSICFLLLYFVSLALETFAFSEIMKKNG